MFGAADQIRTGDLVLTNYWRGCFGFLQFVVMWRKLFRFQASFLHIGSCNLLQCVVTCYIPVFGARRTFCRTFLTGYGMRVGECVYSFSAFSALRTISPARRILSSFACAYIFRVVEASACPRRSDTLTTSAPAVIAMLADVCRSLWG